MATATGNPIFNDSTPRQEASEIVAHRKPLATMHLTGGTSLPPPRWGGISFMIGVRWLSPPANFHDPYRDQETESLKALV